MALMYFTVIYFAFGSPIGVCQLTPGCTVRSPRSAMAIAARFILWPIFAVALCKNWLSANENAPDIERQIANIRRKIEFLAFTDNPTILVFEFREIFNRFTGLSIALKKGNASSQPKQELFKVGKHGNIALASACLDRRNRRRLAFHQKQARAEFDYLIVALARSQPNGYEITAIASQLVQVLNGKPAGRNASVNERARQLHAP